MGFRRRKNDDKSSSSNRSGSFFGPTVQTKLKVGQPNDRYEQEADAMADQIMAGGQGPDAVMTKGLGDSVEEELQQKPNHPDHPLAESVTPLMQLKPELEQEESLQAKVEELGDEEAMQMKGEEEEEEALQAKGEEEEESVQAKEASRQVTPSFESKLKSSTGTGQKLNGPVRQQMESGFGADFGHINIHTDANAESMNKQVGAKAFAHGNDIYFNKGQYNPKTKEGQHLIAHELTHTIQQKGMVQKKEDSKEIYRTGDNVQGFWGEIWDGITGIGSAIGNAASAAWGGIQSIAGWGWDVLKSAGAWVWDFATMLPERVWRLLQHVGSGIVGVVSWLWDGFTGALGHIWDAVTGVLGWAASGITGFFSWIWRGLQGGGTWAYRLLQGDFSGFWEGIGDAFSWLGDGVVGLAKWGWEGLSGAVIWAAQGVWGIARWIGRGLWDGSAWVLRLVAKLLDLVGFGEIMTLLFNIVKFNTRTLTSGEQAEAQRVFGNSISYWQVRIDEMSLISMIGAFFQNADGMGVTLWHTINFNREINATAGSWDMAWLIHELVHVAQYEHVGTQYLGEAIHSQATTGYGYGDGAGLAGKNFSDFNREQQGDILKHYYFYVLSGNNDARYTPYASDYIRMRDQAQRGEY